MRISDWSSDVCSSDLLGRVELTAFTIAGDAVALDVTQMRAGRAQPLGFVEPDDPRLHHDAAVAPGVEPVAARKLPACDIDQRDVAAGTGAGDAACSARQGSSLTNPLKIAEGVLGTAIRRRANLSGENVTPP